MIGNTFSISLQFRKITKFINIEPKKPGIVPAQVFSKVFRISLKNQRNKTGGRILVTWWYFFRNRIF